MEILTIILSALLSLGSSGGFILDRVVQGRLASQVIDVEQQAIRIDNRPNYRLAQGKVERVRIASRGLKIKPGLRIAAIDLETDQIALKLAATNFKNLDGLRASLQQPVSGMVRLEVTESDLNQALQSPEILAQLQTNLNQTIASRAGSRSINYQISNLRLELLSSNRLQVGLTLTRPAPKTRRDSPQIPGNSQVRNRNRARELNIVLSVAFQVVNGTTVQLSDPTGTINGRPLSSRLLKGFAEGISDRLDLNLLSDDGIISRILQLKINEDKLELISFIRLETKAQ